MKKSLTNLFADASERDKRSAGMIINAIENNNIDGFDYLEFKQSIEKLAEMGMDEATRYKSAFVTASTLGLTRDKLLKTASFYRGIVVKEKSKFEKAMQQRMTTGVKDLEGNVGKLEKAISDRKERIAKLQAEVEKYEAKLEQTKDEIENMSEKVAEAKAGFERAYEVILEQIDEDVSNIETYIS